MEAVPHHVAPHERILQRHHRFLENIVRLLPQRVALLAPHFLQPKQLEHRQQRQAAENEPEKSVMFLENTHDHTKVKAFASPAHGD